MVAVSAMYAFLPASPCLLEHGIGEVTLVCVEINLGHSPAAVLSITSAGLGLEVEARQPVFVVITGTSWLQQSGAHA